MIVYYKRIGTAGSATVRPQCLGTVAGNLKTIKPIIIFISAGNFPVTAFVVFDFLCLYSNITTTFSLVTILFVVERVSKYKLVFFYCLNIYITQLFSGCIEHR